MFGPLGMQQLPKVKLTAERAEHAEKSCSLLLMTAEFAERAEEPLFLCYR